MLHVTKPDRKSPAGRILLVNPPLEEPYRYPRGNGTAPGDNADVDNSHACGRQYIYPLPIGLMRIAGQRLREGNEVYFLDGFSSLGRRYPSSRNRRTASDLPGFPLSDRWQIRYCHLGLRYEEMGRLLRHVDVDEVLVGCTFTYHNDAAHRAIEVVREKLPEATIRFGGIYPTLAPEVARTSRADEIFTGAYPGIEDEALNYDFLGVPPGFILIKGTSGCPNRCAYCAVHLLEGNRFRHRDPEEVVAEIRAGCNRYHLRRVAIWDSNILMQYDDYFGIVLRKLIDSDMKLRLAAPEGFDYRLLTPEMARELKAAGFATISLALENIDTAYTRTRLNRSNNIGRLESAVAALKDAGFPGRHIRLFVIIGLPGQTIDNVLENIRFAWSLGCNVTLFPFTPIPGTLLYEENLAELHGLPLRALHPSLYPCIPDPDVRNQLVELAGLAILNGQSKSQVEHFREVIRSPELQEQLAP